MKIVDFFNYTTLHSEQNNTEMSNSNPPVLITAGKFKLSVIVLIH